MSQSNYPNIFLNIEIDQKPIGQIIIQLYHKTCPKTSQNFQALCTGEKGFGYKNTIFHRIVPNYMAQGGDFVNSNGTGGHSSFVDKDSSDSNNKNCKKYFADENFIHKHDSPYLLSMANSGRNTNGSQFFITMAACQWLDGKHVVFGKIIDGQDVVKSIEECGSNPSGNCSKRVVISDCGLVSS